MRRFTKGLLVVVGGMGVLVIVGVGISLFLLLRAISPSGLPDGKLDTERLEKLRSDPIYSIRYPNATELRRWEHGSRGFAGGVEDPPTSVYYAGTNDSDDKIIGFFVDRVTSYEWYIFEGPEKMTSVERVSIIFHKDNVGSLFVTTFEPERLNRLLRGEKLPTNYSTIFQVTLRAKHLER